MKVIENLNNALHYIFAKYTNAFLIGEDVIDPYGGAFKVSKGLSSLYPDRVLSTPISELAISGMAGGLALCGNRPIVEIMFGDFITLCFDQILNFASKSVTMFGHKLDMNLVVRCPVGGNRGYGPTHSQSLQKHFIGIPNLELYELTPFHDNKVVFEKLLNLNKPSIFFEDKALYTKPFYEVNLDRSLVIDSLKSDNDFIRVALHGSCNNRCMLISTGGLAYSCIEVMKKLLVEYEIESHLFIPSKLYPFQIEPLEAYLKSADHIFIIEESVAGGTWGAELSVSIYNALWGKIKNNITLIHSKDSVIPAAIHLEKEILIQPEDILKMIVSKAVKS